MCTDRASEWTSLASEANERDQTQSSMYLQLRDGTPQNDHDHDDDEDKRDVDEGYVSSNGDTPYCADRCSHRDAMRCDAIKLIRE